MPRKPAHTTLRSSDMNNTIRFFIIATLIWMCPCTLSAASGAQNNTGWTPLLWAASSGNISRVKAQIAAGGAINARDTYGRTVLMVAAKSGSVDCVKALIAAGADVNAKGGGGFTALLYASKLGKAECVRALVAAGADLKAMTDYGYGAIALANGDRDVISALKAVVAPQTAPQKTASTGVDITDNLPVPGAPRHCTFSASEVARAYLPPQVFTLPRMGHRVTIHGTEYKRAAVRFEYSLPGGWQTRDAVFKGFRAEDNAVVGPNGVLASVYIETLQAYKNDIRVDKKLGLTQFTYDSVAGPWIAGVRGYADTSSCRYANWQGLEGSGSVGTIWDLDFVRAGSQYVVGLNVFVPHNNPEGAAEANAFVGAVMASIRIEPRR